MLYQKQLFFNIPKNYLLTNLTNRCCIVLAGADLYQAYINWCCLPGHIGTYTSYLVLQGSTPSDNCLFHQLQHALLFFIPSISPTLERIAIPKKFWRRLMVASLSPSLPRPFTFFFSSRNLFPTRC